MSFYVYPGIHPAAAPSLDGILSGCLEACSVPESEVLSRSRRQLVTRCRMLYVYFACLKTTSLVTAIGARIGKDHATVIYYRNRAKDLISVKDSWLMPAYHQISSMLVQKGYYNNLTSTQVT